MINFISLSILKKKKKMLLISQIYDDQREKSLKDSSKLTKEMWQDNKRKQLL